jgi:2,3,4,5-tetrahydropyridine-2-carboxylate N-succinyltransferase
MNENFKSIIEKAWDDRSILHTTEVKEAINAIIDQLDKGELRVAEPTADG